MRNFKEITRRINIQEIRSFVLDGIDLSSWCVKPDVGNYEERLRKGETPLWEFLDSLYPDGDERDDVYDIVCDAIITNQEVYTELGMRLGANLILELLQKNPFEEDKQ